MSSHHKNDTKTHLRHWTSNGNTRNYRATKLWNELTYSLRERMSCKTHRRNLKSHENCFPGSKAVEVVHSILQENDNFDHGVTRIQAIKLLQKFLEKRVIETVSGKWENEIFTGDNKLYRFYQETVDKAGLSTPSRSSRPNAPLLSPDTKAQIFSPPLLRRYATSPAFEKSKKTSQFLKGFKGDELRFLPKCLLPATD